MIEFRGVFFGKEALNDVSLRVKPSEKVVLLGPNGSGKSTLLKIIAGLLFPGRGEYIFWGTGITKKIFKDRNFRRDFRRRVQIVFQEPDIMLFNPTVYDEIAFGLRVFNYDNENERVENIAKNLFIDSLLERPVYELSGGEKQKVAIASTLVLEPDVLLLDEPTAYLDMKSTFRLSKIVKKSKITVVAAVHDIHTARLLGDRYIVLSNSHKIVFDGSFDELISERKVLSEYGIHILDDFECVKEERNGG